MSKDNIVMVISDLGGGGAQRVVTTIANQWALSGKAVTIVTFADEAQDFFTLNEKVKRKSLCVYGPTKNLKDAFFTNLSRLWKLRQVIKSLSPEVVISFIGITNILVILATTGLKVRIIISERSDPAIEYLGRPWQLLRTLLYRYADIITANSHGAIETMRKYVPGRKLRYLPNPVMINTHQTDDKSTGRDNLILAVGSLRYEKGYDILLNAFAAVENQLPGWKVVIIGDGVLSEDLKKQVEELGIDNKVIWTGRIDDPAHYYKKASIFVLPSRREGMPNVLLEAMSCKLPVIITDSSPGPLEVVQNNKNGIVIPANDYEALSGAIVLLAKNESLSEKLGNKASETISEYDYRKVIKVWESVIGLNPKL